MGIPRPQPWMVALAGPLLIVITLAIVLHDFIFGGLISHLNPDVESVFMLNHCYLGDQIKAGNLPTWNPRAMGGAPFAADPQSGWFYLVPTILNAFLRCSVAIRIFTVLPAFVAALAVYALLRTENAGRVSATCGGLVMGLMIAGSKILVNLPFSDSLAWTAVLLVCGAKTLRSPRWSGRIMWVLAAGIAWGQLAAAHSSHGLMMGTTLLIVYLVHVALGERERDALSWPAIASIVGLMFLAFGFVNLGRLLPVFDYVDRSSLGLGYDELLRRAAELRGLPAPELEVFRALSPTWPLRIATAPGLYLGAVTLMAAPAAFVAAKTRRLAILFGVTGVVFYVLGLEAFAEWLSPHIEGLPYADFYRHSPGRFLYGCLFVIVVLTGLGLEAWRQLSWRARIAVAAPALVFWIAAPLAFGSVAARSTLFAIGALGGGLALIAASRRPAWAWVLPLVLALELATNAFVGQGQKASYAVDGLKTSFAELPMRPLAEPEIDARAYAKGGPLERELLEEREVARLLYMGEGLTWMFRPVVAGVEVANGYNPVQLRRYWMYMRTVVRDEVRYNLSIFPTRIPPPATLDLLQVGWIALPKNAAAPEDATRVAEDSRRVLYRLDSPSPRFELVDGWFVAESPDQALGTIVKPGWPIEDTVVLEDEPSFTGRRNSAERTGLQYRIDGPTSITVRTESRDREILLIRNVFDENWSATVDGAPADLMPANYLVQGVALGPGRHTVRLSYEDPNIVTGAVGSGVSVLVLMLGAAIAGLLERRVQG